MIICPNCNAHLANDLSSIPKKCSNCNGTGHIENQFNDEISNLQIQSIEENSNKSNSIKTLDLETSNLNEKQEQIIEKENLNPKNLYKDESSNKKDNDDLNLFSSKEKNILTVDLTDDEKIVFSQLGINPLIKLGKEYLTSNNFVRLKDHSKGKEKTLDNKEAKSKTLKKFSKSKDAEDIGINIEANANSKNKSTKKTNENEEVVFLDKKNELETTEEISNARKKRRRSSASIE